MIFRHLRPIEYNTHRQNVEIKLVSTIPGICFCVEEEDGNIFSIQVYVWRSESPDGYTQYHKGIARREVMKQEKHQLDVRCLKDLSAWSIANVMRHLPQYAHAINLLDVNHAQALQEEAHAIEIFKAMNIAQRYESLSHRDSYDED